MHTESSIFKFPLRSSGLMALTAAALVACGGGDTAPSASGPSAGTGGGGTAGVSVSGTVATGAALAGAKVDFKCASGSLSGTADSSGAYKIEAGSVKFPCLGRGTSTDGKTVLHTLATGAGTVNITTMTELATAKALGADPKGKFDSFDPTTVSSLTADSLTKGMEAALAYVKALGVDTTAMTTDHFSKAFKAAVGTVTGDDTDKVLDKLYTALGSSGKSLGDAASDVVKGVLPSSPGDVISGSANVLKASGSLTATPSSVTSMTAFNADRLYLYGSSSWVHYGFKEAGSSATAGYFSFQLNDKGGIKNIAYMPSLINGKAPVAGGAYGCSNEGIAGGPPSCGKVDFKIDRTLNQTTITLAGTELLRNDIIASPGVIANADAPKTIQLTGSVTGGMTGRTALMTSDVPVFVDVAGTISTEVGIYNPAAASKKAISVVVENQNWKYNLPAIDGAKVGEPMNLEFNFDLATGKLYYATLSTKGDATTPRATYWCSNNPNSDLTPPTDCSVGSATVSKDLSTLTFKDLKLASGSSGSAAPRVTQILLNGSLKLKN